MIAQNGIPKRPEELSLRGRTTTYAIEPNPDGSIKSAPTPETSGGLLVFRSLNLQPTAQNVKLTPGQLYGWYLSNHNTSTPRFVKFYNRGDANENDTPFMTLELPPGSAANFLVPHGLPFTVSLSVRATVNVSDTDTAAPSANDVVCNLFYW